MPSCFTTTLHLEPEHAFGDYKPALVFFEERSVFSEAVEVGMQFDGLPPGAATQGMPADAIYSLTKHAVVGFVRSAAPAVAPIRLNAICPGIADTPMLDRHDQRPQFEQAENEARQKKRGLWKSVRESDMPAWRQDWLKALREKRAAEQAEHGAVRTRKCD